MELSRSGQVYVASFGEYGTENHDSKNEGNLSIWGTAGFSKTLLHKSYLSRTVSVIYVQLFFLLPFTFTFLGAVVQSRKERNTVVIYVRLSVRTYQPGYHWKDFRDISCWGL